MLLQYDRLMLPGRDLEAETTILAEVVAAILENQVQNMQAVFIRHIEITSDVRLINEKFKKGMKNYVIRQKL